MVNLLAQTLVDLPSRVGSNWGGFLFSVVLFTFSQWPVLRKLRNTSSTPKEMWLNWQSHWVKNLRIGAITIIVGWVVLYAISIVPAIYEDHQDLVGAAARLKKSYKAEIESREGTISRMREALNQGNSIAQ